MNEPALDTAYFERRARAMDRFWSRLGGRPDVSGLRVLDIGCGDGAFCLDAARRGAARVDGVDIDAPSLAYARTVFAHIAPECMGRIALHHMSILDFPGEDLFDVIVSEDTFEHLEDPPAVLDAAARLLRPGGYFYVGFGPLWRSPFGGHRRMHLKLPWAHALLPERWVLAWANRYRTPPARSIMELGMNRWSLRAFEELLLNGPLEVTYFRVNHGDRTVSRMFRLLSRIPFLREPFGHDIYAILRKPG